MKRSTFPGAVLLLLTASPPVLQTEVIRQSSVSVSELDQHKGLLTTYCVTCHNSRLKTGGLALDSLNIEAAAEDAQIWEKAIRKLRGRLMPPPGNRQPEQNEIDAFIAYLENNLDTHAKGPKAGHVPIQRLNRTEYAAAVKALVGVEIKTKDALPQDVSVDGFDNIATALSTSPAFVDQYITSARTIAKLAVGNPNPRVANVKYLVNQNSDEVMPPGTRGGIRFKHNFPADGEYRINFPDLAVGLYTGSVENASTLVMTIDGKVVIKKPIGGREDLALADRKGADGRAQIMSRFQKIPVQVQAGIHDVLIAFIERSRFESGENIAGGQGAFGGRMPRLVDGVEIVGPYNPTGVSTTTSRALIFVCDPKTKGEPACAKQITENLARRAFRRPATEQDLSRLMPFYEAGRREAQARQGEATSREAQARQGEATSREAQARQGEATSNDGGTFDQGIEQVVAAVLGSPEFLYRAIRGPAGASQNAEFNLTDLELASRLSFFLWNTGPDDELLDLAASGGLSKPGVFDAQVKRMLADSRASSLVTSFAMKWLHLDDLDLVKPDPMVFQGFNDQLRKDFLTEVESFIASVLLEDHSVLELLTADHTFLNDRLARHYGIDGISGSQFRRVTLKDPTRFGLLGKAAVLMRTSYADRTSPVLRGAWVLDKLQGTPPAPPPPNVETNLAQTAGEKPKTVRVRLEEHRSKPLCNQCHGVIDPMGLPLENFDAIGQYRTTDRQAAAAIDASTVLPSGVAINGPVELRAQLAGRPAMFAQALTEKLMMYALNRELEYFDMPQVRAVVRKAAKENYKFSSIVLGIVNTDAFRKQAPAPAPK
jgi:mono/diheme cytochrome c family protein